MLSKCANPACSAVFRYLHEGKLFLLSKAPPSTSLADALTDSGLTERYWLCDTCSKKMRVAWSGDVVTVMPVRAETKQPPAAAREKGVTMQTTTEVESQGTRTRWGLGRILVATDFSEPSRRALSEALALASQYSGRLYLAHAILPEPGIMNWETPADLDTGLHEAQRRMKEFLRDMGPHHNIDGVLIRRGPVASVLDAIVQEEHIDLLVIGTRGRGGLRKLALGSVAEELLRVAPCPVLTVGPKAGGAKDPSAQFHTILFATDFGKASSKALPIALSLVDANRAKLVLLHMIPPMPSAGVGVYAYSPAAAVAEEVQTWRTAVREQGLAQLKQCIPPGTKLAQQPEFIVETEFLPEGILVAAATRHAGLIVMGANRALSARAAAHYPWALVHEVVCQAPCPVLTVAG